MTRFLYVPVFLPSYILVRLDRLTIALNRAINPYILSLIYSLIYRWYILWGRGFFPSLIYYEGGYLVAAKECSIYRTGVRRRWKKANACLYILSYYIGEYISFVRTFSTPQCFPLLVCSTGSIGGAFIIR